MVRKQTIIEQIDLVSLEIQRLQEFRQTPTLRKFLRGLIGEKMNLQDKLRKRNQSKQSKEQEKQKKRTEANKKRSQKNRRNWNYIKSIAKNYDTGKSVTELRTEFSKFKKGLESDIQDVIWRNPSP